MSAEHAMRWQHRTHADVTRHWGKDDPTPHAGPVDRCPICCPTCAATTDAHPHLGDLSPRYLRCDDPRGGAA